MWAFPVLTSVSTTLVEALDEFEEWLECDGTDFLVLCNIEDDHDTTRLLCFKQAESAGSNPNTGGEISDCEKQDRQRLLQTASVRSRSSKTAAACGWRDTLQFTSTLIVVALLLGLIAVTMMFMRKPMPEHDPTCLRITKVNSSFVQQPEEHKDVSSAGTANIPAASPSSSAGLEYIEFPTPSSNTGPRHQQYLLPSNVSVLPSLNGSAGEFILRLDDQALMPAAFVDERELEVQGWFATNFPLLASVRDSGRYLEPSYLDYSGTATGPERLLLHERFHIAHCTTAFRRYLRAVREDRHVCPRDLDLDHLSHCTHQLESFAYRPRESWGAVSELGDLPDRILGHDEESDPDYMQVVLTWHTDVCY